jgi:hypothetical protein
MSIHRVAVDYADHSKTTPRRVRITFGDGHQLEVRADGESPTRARAACPGRLASGPPPAAPRNWPSPQPVAHAELVPAQAAPGRSRLRSSPEPI